MVKEKLGFLTFSGLENEIEGSIINLVLEVLLIFETRKNTLETYYQYI